MNKKFHHWSQILIIDSDKSMSIDHTTSFRCNSHTDLLVDFLVGGNPHASDTLSIPHPQSCILLEEYYLLAGSCETNQCSTWLVGQLLLWWDEACQCVLGDTPVCQSNQLAEVLIVPVKSMPNISNGIRWSMLYSSSGIESVSPFSNSCYDSRHDKFAKFIARPR